MKRTGGKTAGVTLKRQPGAELQLSRLIRHRRVNTKSRGIDTCPRSGEMDGIIDVERIP
jgi:hypothetical protein